MKIFSAEELLTFIENSHHETLYLAAKEYARHHKNYLAGGRVAINATSQTVMGKLLQKTQETPAENLDSMRENRAEALEDFCFIYGGYISMRLKNYWEKEKLPDIPEKEAFIALAARQVVAKVVKTLGKDGYRKGTLHHLIHMACKRKSKDVLEKYGTWKKNNNGKVSFERAEDILGGEIEIDFDKLGDENGKDTIFFDDNEEKELTMAGLLSMLPYVKTENTCDDREMFLRLYVKRQKAEDIAEDMGTSPSTVRRHAQDVAFQARELYYKKMEQF